MESLNSSTWATDVDGDFPVHKAVLSIIPQGMKVISGESCGISSWTKTAKLTARLPDNNQKIFFLKCATGQSAQAIMEGEYRSILEIHTLASLTPKPIGWGKYRDGKSQVFFLLTDFHNMDFSTAPDPQNFIAKLVELHSQGRSPTGKFGFPVPTVCGRMERTVTWETSWAKSFTHQLRDVIKYDNEANKPWPEFDAACKQLIDVVIPRLLGPLQSEGRDITPTLIHGDLWEHNVGIDTDTGEVIAFDAGSTYAHNEMEFGTWRCHWATYFREPTYTELYKARIPPSEPKAQYDDRIRLYSLHPYLNASAGHPGSISRRIAYNDMLYLCEKYGPLETLEKYNPERDISVTGSYAPFEIKQLE